MVNDVVYRRHLDTNHAFSRCWSLSVVSTHSTLYFRYYLAREFGLIQAQGRIAYPKLRLSMKRFSIVRPTRIHGDRTLLHLAEDMMKGYNPVIMDGVS